MLKPREKTSQKMFVDASDEVNYGIVFKNQANVKGNILPVNVKNYQLIIEKKLNFKSISLGLKANFAFMQ